MVGQGVEVDDYSLYTYYTYSNGIVHLLFLCFFRAFYEVEGFAREGPGEVINVLGPQSRLGPN